MMKVCLVWLLSAVVHAGMIAGFVLILRFIPLEKVAANDTSPDQATTTTQIDEEAAQDQLDLTNPDLGNDPTQQLNYNVSRIEDVSVPGAVDPTQAVGVPNTPEGLRQNVTPPPGVGQGTAGGATGPSSDNGVTNIMGEGGYSGITSAMAGGFAGRSGSTRVQMLKEGGGNAASEAAVANGLIWLARHQAPDGHWSLNHFELYAHNEESPTGKIEKCTCTGQVNREDDIAATGFALLPFLGAGQTQKPNKEANQKDYSKTVKAGLDFLIAKQGKDGYFGGSMYSHGIATIAICEAYGMTSDPSLKTPAQKAIRFIESAQDSGGGWRYSPKQAGDLSVTGWEVMGLKSGQMAGLELANKDAALKGADRFLDSVESSNRGGYSYMPGNPETVVMTAVGMLCRQYRGVNPRNPGLLEGVKRIESVPPGKANNIYYEYYATQVMHHMGGDGVGVLERRPRRQRQPTGIRDTLIARQCTTAEKPGLPGAKPPLPANLSHEQGSWDPDGAWGADGGGRIMYTSLSLLTLEVYYRHLPLYRREMGGQKDMPSESK